jgi:hypothetical protein
MLVCRPRTVSLGLSQQDDDDPSSDDDAHFFDYDEQIVVRPLNAIFS